MVSKRTRPPEGKTVITLDLLSGKDNFVSLSPLTAVCAPIALQMTKH